MHNRPPAKDPMAPTQLQHKPAVWPSCCTAHVGWRSTADSELCIKTGGDAAHKPTDLSELQNEGEVLRTNCSVCSLQPRTLNLLSCPFMHTCQLLTGKHTNKQPLASTACQHSCRPICWHLPLKASTLHLTLSKPRKQQGKFRQIHFKQVSSLKLQHIYFHCLPPLGCPMHACSSPLKEVQLSSPTEIHHTAAEGLCLSNIVLCKKERLFIYLLKRHKRRHNTAIL